MVSMRKQRQEERNWRPPDIEPLTPAQRTHLTLLSRLDCVVAQGPAGTGKTFLTCSFAAQELVNKNTSQIVLTRPTIGLGGRTMGFLPGNISRKMEPWARPLVEAFKRSMSAKRYEERVNAGDIRIESLEHVRGLTFDSSILIIDEAQNTTPLEMKAILTRIGEYSSVYVCGDCSQSDLGHEDNGLSWVVRAVDRGLVPEVGMVQYTHADVVRSELCAAWAEAFETLEREQAASRGGLRPIRACELA